MTDRIQIDEYAISLANTESLLGQDVSDSGADEDNRTSAVSTDPPLSRPTSPRPINLIQTDLPELRSDNKFEPHWIHIQSWLT